MKGKPGDKHLHAAIKQATVIWGKTQYLVQWAVLVPMIDWPEVWKTFEALKQMQVLELRLQILQRKNIGQL